MARNLDDGMNPTFTALNVVNVHSPKGMLMASGRGRERSILPKAEATTATTTPVVDETLSSVPCTGVRYLKSMPSTKQAASTRPDEPTIRLSFIPLV
jgi:hypothetical protein